MMIVGMVGEGLAVGVERGFLKGWGAGASGSIGLTFNIGMKARAS